MEEASKKLRTFTFDKIRLEKVNQKNFREELNATLARETICKRMLDLVKEKKKLANSYNSSLGFVLGITDELPSGRPPIWFDSELPDIDLDFSDQRRHLVFEYAEKKYGIDRVARLGTISMFKPRSALNQAGIALQIPRWQVEKVLDGVIERSGGDSRALQALEDTLTDTEAGRKMLADFPAVKIAGRMEGHPNNASQHAAGIVITQEPVAEYVAVDRRSKSAMVDKKDAEDLNLLKIDALGLTQLSIFERALQLIGKPDKSGYLETLPLDDPKAFEVLNKGNFAGVFQFNGTAMQSLTKQIKINSFNDIVSITALARPGPMSTGGAGAWAKRRRGEEEVTTLHPMLTELTKETFGVIAYQEQVIRIVREMGNFSWEDTSAIRKAMSGRLGNEFFDNYGKKFRAGALLNGVDDSTADAVWRQVNSFGSWAMNFSHCVAYGHVSYYCCWLKAKHPLEFAAATLDAESDPAKQVALLRELKGEGIDYVPVDPEKSTDRWVPAKRGKRQYLVGPLTAIKGIGPATLLEIMDARKTKVPLRENLAKRLAAAKTKIDTLYPVADRIKQLHPNLAAVGIASAPTPISQVQVGINHEVMVLAVVKKIAPKDENENVNVMKRGGKVLSGPTAALNLFFQDDTDEIFAKINRFDFERIGREVVERGRSGKALYAIKGTVPRRFRMISINRIKYLGDMEDGNI